MGPLDGDVLKPQFREQLMYLKERSKSTAEKQKCDHLAACLLLSNALQDTKHSGPRDKTPTRPKTAMATLERNMWDPYETSMNRDYPYKVGLPTEAFRPKTSNGYRNPYQLCDPVGMSIYTDEFCCKPYSKPDLIRAATASGARSHNPNPNKDPTFITWRPPREKVPLDTDSLGMKPPSAEDVQRTIRAQYCSTYKGDYLGLPQGYQIKYAINPPPNWKREIPRPLDTESRFNYQIQPRAPELRDFTRKYGCYSHLHVPSKGAVPTVISSHIRNQENKKQLTTYQRHFGKEYVNFSLLVNSLDPEELKMYLRNVPVEDRRGLVRFVNAVSESKCHPIESK
uniref:Testis expressed 26 n=1 Tax=Leptobrachium leishanense TaxID=445787 RepID=A0A8C5QAX6_9ANUR